ncbi:hypothetical protein GCM10010218_53560 [Streptomyces mashuensis]|uniref:DUF1876 domain-containing protein n=1 Tax=Streptomyces mashuensis TaxID=33904 RepID=A0A919B945_9ACTN|nr:dsRBD fold-containing protein [Streptomyces mashuensis]GHF65367.1 hypothetical protein GCM10010218_53560 [Streptomyces mashuensis]
MEKIVDCGIQMQFREIDADTQADVKLRLHDGSELSAQGVAHRHPDDPRQQRVGEEVAAARALTGLADQLLEKAGHDMESTLHHEVHLTR